MSQPPMFADFSYGVGELCDQPGSGGVLQPLCSLTSANAMTAWPCQSQQGVRRVLPLSSPACASRPHGKSATMVPSSTSISREHLSCPLPLQAMFPDQQINFPHVWSRCFSNCCFLLGLGVRETSKRGFSVSYSTLGSPEVNPMGFPSQTFWGLSFWCGYQMLECLIRSTNPLLL